MSESKSNTNTHADAANNAGFGKNIWKSIIAAFFIMWIAIAVVKKLPIIVWQKAEVVELTDTSVSLAVSGIKIRDCAYVPSSPIGFVRTEFGIRKITDFGYPDISVNRSRERSPFRTDFGVWRWDWSEIPEMKDETAYEVLLLSQNVCGTDAIVAEDNERGGHSITGDLRFSVIGPFKVNQE